MKNIVEIMRRTWTITNRHHQVGTGDKAERFQVNDIVLYITDSEPRIARITKIHGNYSTVLVADGQDKTKNRKYKNIHHRFLISLVRISSEPEVSKYSSSNEGSTSDLSKQNCETQNEGENFSDPARLPDSSDQADPPHHNTSLCSSAQSPSYIMSWAGQLVISLQEE